ncbi:MAG: histidine kinase, partial [Chloroflexi bacterium]
RLYDIDLLINRTLVYAGLTACVVGIYILIVGYLGSLSPSGGNSALSLLATGIIAILFQPLRERLQRGINRLLYGQRDEPYAVLSKLGQRLEATLAPEAVLSTIVQTVREALKLSYTAIALQRSEKLAIAAEVGTAASDPLRLPLMYQREPVGELLLGSRAAGEAFSAADRRLLDDLARQAGVAVHAVRLTGDLQQSRMRLVSAREEERRRLRRDLHDGLGPELASMTLQTEAAREYLTSDPTRSDALLADLTAQLQAATAEIRRLVYELRPPALDDLGLAAALRTLAARYDHEAPDALRVDVEAWAFPRSLPAAAEVAAYRICQEALTNVVRHARARHCTLRLVLTNENGRSAALSVEIRDDGCGLPVDRRAGVGLASMRERAAELGGTCSIESVPTGGTRVTAMLPLPVLTPSASAVESEPSPELTVGSTA